MLFLPLLGIRKHLLAQKVEMGPRLGQSDFPMAIVMGESWDPVKSSEL